MPESIPPLPPLPPLKVTSNSSEGESQSRIHIEKGLPIPKLKGPGAKNKYPWGEMEIGDSFSVKLSNNPDKIRLNLLNSAKNWSKYNNKNYKFKTRTIKEDGVVRIWRVE